MEYNQSMFFQLFLSYWWIIPFIIAIIFWIISKSIIKGLIALVMTSVILLVSGYFFYQAVSPLVQKINTCYSDAGKLVDKETAEMAKLQSQEARAKYYCENSRNSMAQLSKCVNEIKNDGFMGKLAFEASDSGTVLGDDLNRYSEFCPTYPPLVLP